MSLNIDKNITALIFDIDGTLADSMPTHFSAYQKVLLKYGITFTPELFSSMAGSPIIPQMNLIKQIFNPDGFDPEKVAEERETEYRKVLHTIKPIEPIVSILKQYYGKLPIACGTGNDRETSLKTLEIIGVANMVDVLVSCNDVENGKPAPDTFLKCAELLGVAPCNCHVFEDADQGIKAAISAGMTFTDVRCLLSM